MLALRPIPPFVFLVLYSFLALSQANALVASVGRTHPRIGPPHLYLERRLEGTPIVDGNPGKLLKWDVWFTEDALFATFRAVILFVVVDVYVIYYILYSRPRKYFYLILFLNFLNKTKQNETK
jgi:hypothetical protein